MFKQNNESWDKRWLRGDKVTKVLATAKLANKMRSNIKGRKTKAIIETPKSIEIERKLEEPKAISSNVEVGSVDHYKELTKQKQKFYSSILFVFK